MILAVPESGAEFHAAAGLGEVVARGQRDRAERFFATGMRVKRALRRIETLGVPVVAALGGPALGGGLEIALACHHRIALDSPRVLLGLPEASLGLVPAGGGVIRSVRLLGITPALGAVLLEGQRHAPARAASVGLVDELARSPEDLIRRARAFIDAHAEARQPWDVPGYRIPGGAPDDPALAGTLPAFPALLRQRTGGGPRPAPRAILAAAVEGAQVGIDAAAVVEARLATEVALGQPAANMTGAFHFDLAAITAGGGLPAPQFAGAGALEPPWDVPGPHVSRLVRDDPGSFAARILGCRLREGAALVGDGVAPASVEQAARQAGYATGVLALLDEVSLPLARRLRDESRAAVTAAGGAWDPDPGDAVIDRMAGEFGRSGEAAGAGFYDYAEGRRVRLWPGLRQHFTGPGTDAPLRELGERLLFAEALEAVRLLHEGVVASAAEANVASLVGIGFPAWTGGVLRYVHGYDGGARRFADRAAELARRYGPRFAPPPPLAAAAGAGARRGAPRAGD